MQFASPLIRATLIKREKRFFVHAMRQDTGETVTAHTPNTGSLKGVFDEAFGNPPVAAVWLLDHGPDTKRTLRYTHELTEKTDGTLIGSHTGRANHLAIKALAAGLIPPYQPWACRMEVKFDAGTRFDLHLTCPNTSAVCWGEVKNVTLAINRQAAFPDSVTERGAKHLRHLTDIVRSGQQALQIFMVQREDVDMFIPADSIDPTYAEALRVFHAAGGHIAAIGCRWLHDDQQRPTGIVPVRTLPLAL